MSLDVRLFGPYRLDELLGRGGMGEVYRAYDTEHRRNVAIKLLAAHLADDDEFQGRFRREAFSAARLSNPHVVPIHRYGVIDNRLYIDMRLVEGGDLDELISAGGPLALDRAVRMIEQVASALEDAHRNGLVHRDVKPSNILLDGQVADFCYLADFGVTRLATALRSNSLTRTGAILGSLAYMAPEQFEGAVTTRSDIYSLACVLFELLTGRKPYVGDGLPALMHAHINVPPPRPSSHNPAAAPFDDVIATGMAKDADARFASAGELARAARAALDGHRGQPAVTSEPSTSEPTDEFPPGSFHRRTFPGTPPTAAPAVVEVPDPDTAQDSDTRQDSDATQDSGTGSNSDATQDSGTGSNSDATQDSDATHDSDATEDYDTARDFDTTRDADVPHYSDMPRDADEPHNSDTAQVSDAVHAPAGARRHVAPLAAAAAIIAVVAGAWAIATSGSAIEGHALPQAVPAAAAPSPTPAPTLAPAAAPAPGPVLAEAIFTGRTSGNELTIAIGIKDGRAAGYVCDGHQVEGWLEGTVSGNQVTLHGRDAGTSVTATADQRSVLGTVTLGGDTRPFSAQIAVGAGGLYQSKRTVQGITTRIGWIVLPDGTQVGVRRQGDLLAPAPALDTATGDAVDDGQPVHADRVSGASVVLGG